MRERYWILLVTGSLVVGIMMGALVVLNTEPETPTLEYGETVHIITDKTSTWPKNGSCYEGSNVDTIIKNLEDGDGSKRARCIRRFLV